MTSAREAVADALAANDCVPEFETCARAAEVALSAFLTWLSSNGYVIVPKEPTTEMVKACLEPVGDVYPCPENEAALARDYRAMLSAAPQPDLGK